MISKLQERAVILKRLLTDPSTNCFLTSVRDHPIQLWDVTTGTVRASYSAIDHCEKFIGPNVLSFNLDGSK